MKKFKTALIILLMPLLYYLFVTGFKETGLTGGNKAFNSPTTVTSKNFENIIFNLDSSTISNASGDHTQWIPGQISHYKGALNFTGIQSYEFGSDNFGFFNQNLTTEQSENIEGLNSIVASHDLDFYFHRPNISNLCYGQRLVFLVTPPPGNNTVNDGFCFGSTGGEYITDQGRNVLHASDIEENPNGYWLAKNIYENKAFAAFDDFGHGATGPWYIKPMMRIPVNTPDNKDVVRIDVINYSNNQIKSVTIKSQNFKDANGNYSGDYIDKYNLDPGVFLTVIGGGEEIHDPQTDLNEGVPHWSKIPNCGYYRVWHTNCHVDFKIYWLGQVECWFEKMTVDDRFADGLLNGMYDYHITDETTLEFFLITALKLKNGDFTEANIPCVNHVMNVMYNKLRNRAVPISLKTPD